MRHPSRLVAACTTLVCAAALAGCGSQPPPGAATGAFPAASTAGTGSNGPRAAAHQDATTLLARFDALPAATRQSAAPRGALAALGYALDAGRGADRPVQLTGWWTMSAPPAAALAAAKALLPPWGAPHPAGLSSDGTSVAGYGVTSQSTGILADQGVTVRVGPLGSGGSVLRVDVDVEWRRPRTAAETLPRASFLTVTEKTVRTIGAAPTEHQGTITDAATIAAIAELVDGLPNSPGLPPVFCPAEPGAGTGLTLVWRASADGPALATVLVHTRPRGECNGWVDLTIGPSTSPVDTLDDSLLRTPLDSRIAALAGLPAIAAPSAPVH